MEYASRSIVITLFINFGMVCADDKAERNFTAILIETVKKFQLKGTLLALHVSYIVLGFLSVLFMFGLTILLLSQHQWCKKKEEEESRTMELVPQNIFEVNFPES